MADCVYIDVVCHSSLGTFPASTVPLDAIISKSFSANFATIPAP